MPPVDYRVDVRIDYPEASSRGWAILTILWIKLLALIPHFIVLIVLSIGAAITFIISQFIVLFTGVYPHGIHDFITGYVRWSTRVGGFTLSLTDEYPPFTLESRSDYPVDVAVEYPKTSSRLLAGLTILISTVLFVIAMAWLANTDFDTGSSTYNYTSNLNFRTIALLPHLIVLGVLGIAVIVVWIVVQWVILFVARFPEGMHGFVVGYVRWSTRVSAWMYGLIDRYPPFTLEPSSPSPWPLAAPGAPGGQIGPGGPAAPLPPPPQPATGGQWVDDRFPPSPPEPAAQPPAQPVVAPPQQPATAPAQQPATAPAQEPATAPTQPLATPPATPEQAAPGPPPPTPPVPPTPPTPPPGVAPSTGAGPAPQTPGVAPGTQGTQPQAPETPPGGEAGQQS